jgi:hypothetical protein
MNETFKTKILYCMLYSSAVFIALLVVVTAVQINAYNNCMTNADKMPMLSVWYNYTIDQCNLQKLWWMK